jgi:nitrite reductase/ring-hydroxylating ferredoxin subunit
MTNGVGAFAQTIKVRDLKPGDPPIDITDIVRQIDSNAIPRILTRMEVSKPDGVEPPPPARFFSIARRCTHSGCNILKGGANWATVERPIVFSMLGTGGVEYAAIECPCHGSRFDLVTGERLLGPAPPGRLARFETKVEFVDGEAYVFVAIAPTPEGGPA